jgi:hypothetical protein
MGSNGYILVGENNAHGSKQLTPHERLLYDILEKKLQKQTHLYIV